MIDPGIVILLLALVALVALIIIAMAIWTLLAGYRWGADPTRRRMRAVWIGGVALEAFAVVAAIASTEPGTILGTAALLSASAAAPLVGRRRHRPTADR